MENQPKKKLSLSDADMQTISDSNTTRRTVSQTMTTTAIALTLLGSVSLTSCSDSYDCNADVTTYADPTYYNDFDPSDPYYYNDSDVPNVADRTCD